MLINLYFRSLKLIKNILVKVNIPDTEQTTPWFISYGPGFFDQNFEVDINPSSETCLNWKHIRIVFSRKVVCSCLHDWMLCLCWVGFIEIVRSNFWQTIPTQHDVFFKKIGKAIRVLVSINFRIQEQSTKRCWCILQHCPCR